jgi:hypothetical protein
LRVEESAHDGGNDGPGSRCATSAPTGSASARPAEPSAANAERDVWRVSAIRQREGDRDRPRVLSDGIEGRDAALSTAREFMGRYAERRAEESGDSGREVETVVEAFRSEGD